MFGKLFQAIQIEKAKEHNQAPVTPEPKTNCPNLVMQPPTKTRDHQQTPLDPWTLFPTCLFMSSPNGDSVAQTSPDNLFTVP